jgi:head-tail adaptor
MTARYVDAAFAGEPNGVNVVWAEDTPHFQPAVTGSTAFATLAAAYVAAVAGDVIYLAAGTHVAPVIQKGVDLVGVNSEDVELGFNAAPYGMTISGAGVLCRVKDCWVRTPVGSEACVLVKGGARAAFVGCKFTDSVSDEVDLVNRKPVSVEARDDGAAVCLGCTGIGPVRGPRGAVGSLPAPVTPRGGGSGRQPGRYGVRAVLEAPATYRGESGGEKRVWIPVQHFYCQFDPARDGDSLAARVVVHGSTGILFCRGGTPITNECRVRYRDRKFEVVGVAALDGVTNEFAVGVVDVDTGEGD